MSIRLRGINKHFGNFAAVDNVDLDVETGELLALLGPSGSGKTTLLRIIAGLEAPDTGSVEFHGNDATDSHARDRQVGFVFQHYALFAHMSIFENVAFGLRVRPRAHRLPEQEIRARVHKLLELVQLDWLADSGSGSRWRARWPSSRGCCCSTSPSVHLMRACARNCAAGCAGCTTRST